VVVNVSPLAVRVVEQYLSKLLEQSTANAQEATEQANKLEIKISKYNAYSEYYTKLATQLLELAWLVFLQYQNKGLYFFGRQEV
jgi:DNA-binding protein H-NS